MSTVRSFFRTLMLPVLGVGLVSGCATADSFEDRIPFTQQMRDAYDLTNDDLMQLQYYLARPITLHRAVVSGGSEIERGKLVDSGVGRGN